MNLTTTTAIVDALLEVAKAIDELAVLGDAEFCMRQQAAEVVRDKADWYRSDTWGGPCSGTVEVSE